MQKSKTVPKSLLTASVRAKQGQLPPVPAGEGQCFPLRKPLRAFLAAAAFAVTAEQTLVATTYTVPNSSSSYGADLYKALTSNSDSATGGHTYKLVDEVTWFGTSRINPSASLNVTIQGVDPLSGEKTLQIIKFDDDDPNTAARTSVYGFTFNAAAETIHMYDVYADAGGRDSDDGFFYITTSTAKNVTLNLEGSTFSNFYASGSHEGGVIGGDTDSASSYTINGGDRGTTFVGNHSNPGNNETTSGGGAITVRAKDELTLKGKLTFENNFSYLFGGAIALANPLSGRQKLIAEEDSFLKFTGNSARVFGGALDVWGYSAEITFKGETLFENNYIYDADGARTGYAKRGGAINIGEIHAYGTVDMTFKEKAIFENNYVIGRNANVTGRHAYGGAISAYAQGAQSAANAYIVTFEKAAIFKGNYVVAPYSTGDGNGGAIFYEATGAKLTLGPGSEFTDNLAQTFGGAIYLKEGTIVLNAAPLEGDRTGDGPKPGDIIFKGNKQGVVFEGAGGSYTANLNLGNPTPNAVYLGSTGTFIVNTEGDSAVHFYDPIQANGSVLFRKTGTGSVIFYDYGSLINMPSVATPTTSVEGGFFVLKLSDDPPANAVTAYGTLGRGTVTVSGTSPDVLGVIVGENGATLQALIININGYGEIWADDPIKTFLIKATNFNLKENGGLGGHGSMSVQDASGTVINIETSGTFIIDAIDHKNPTNPDVTFTLVDSLLQGIGKLKKTGPGIFVMDKNHTYSGGTQVDAGTLRVKFPGATREISNSIGAGTITINKDGRLYVFPDGTGDFTINKALNIHSSGTESGLLQVDLRVNGELNTNPGAPSNNLIFTNATNYDGRVLLENLIYTMKPNPTVSAQLTNAKVEAGANSLLIVPVGVNATGGFKFAGGTVHFNDVTGSSQTGSRINTGALNVNGEGTVRMDNITAAHDLFTNNETPLLQRDDYGLARQLIGAKDGGTISVTGTASALKLKNSLGDDIAIPGEVDLIQGTETVAKQYLLLSSAGLTTGPEKDGLYVGAMLKKLELLPGKTTVFSKEDATVVGGNDFSAQITGTGNLQINAEANTNSIILNNASSSTPNDYTGTTTVTKGRLVGGADNVIEKSSALTVGENGTFDTGNYNQTVQNLSGVGTVAVNTTGDKNLTIKETSSTTFSGALTGSGNIEKTGTGTLTLEGNSTHSGNWTISSGDLTVKGLLGTSGNYTGNIAMKSGSNLVFDQTGNQTLSGNITRGDASATTIEKKGSSTLTLAKDKVIEPQFTLSGGVLAGEGQLYKASFAAETKISPGAEGGTKIGTLTFGENSGSTTTFSNVHIMINLQGSAVSDKIVVNGDVWFGNNNTIDFSWATSDDEGKFRDGSYTIIEATGDLWTADGLTQLTEASALTANFLQGSSAIQLARNFAELRVEIDEATNKSKIILTTWANKNYTIYWNGATTTPGGATDSDDWKRENSNKVNWWTTEITPPTKKDVHFREGDIAMFSDTGAKKVVVENGETIVFAMTVTSADSAVYFFEGGAIKGDPDSWNRPYANDPTHPYEVPSIGSRLLVESKAIAFFSNKIEFPSIEVQGAAVFSNEVKVTGTVGDTFKATGSGYIQLGDGGAFLNNSGGSANILLKDAGTTLGFNRINADYTYSGVISGSGNVEKTGGAATVTLTGEHTYTGGTKVSAGKLQVKGRLGANNTVGNTSDYAGKIELGTTLINNVVNFGRLEFYGADAGHTQILSGTLTGVQGTELIVSNGRKLEISSDQDNSPHYHPGAVGKTAAEYGHNTFAGNISLSDNSELTISGRLNVVVESFDGGTPWGVSYQHSHYAGNIAIGGGSTVNFKYNRDYQNYTGILSGAGNLNIQTGMPFYFNGTAPAFSGKTTVSGGSSFHLNGAGTYGNGGTGSKFTVQTGSSLYVGGGGRIYTENFAMEAGTRLVVNPGKFTIAAGAASNITFGNNTEFVFRVAQTDAVDSIDASTKAKLSFQYASGVGVVLNATSGIKHTLRVDSFGYIPQPSQNGVYPGQYFVLMDGLDIGQMRTNAGVGDTGDLALAIFNTNELYIMNSRFAIYFVDGKLIASQMECRGVPEPGTYGLFSGVFIAGLTFLRRRKKKKI